MKLNQNKFKRFILVFMTMMMAGNYAYATKVSNNKYIIIKQKNIPAQLGIYRHIKFGKNDVYEATLTDNYHAYIYQQPEKIHSLAKSIKEVTQGQNAIIGINGGFYTPDFQPAGLFIDKNIVTQPLVKDSLALSSICINKKGKMFLAKHPNKCLNAFYAMQTGPLIIDDGNVSTDVTLLPQKLTTLKVFFEPQRRTILALSNDGKLVVIITSPLTLLEAANLLKSYPDAFGVKGFQRALDLDGGISTGMYIGFKKNPLYFTEKVRVKTFVLFN